MRPRPPPIRTVLALLGCGFLSGCAPKAEQNPAGQKKEPADEVSFVATVRSIKHINEYRGGQVRYLPGMDAFVLVLDVEGAPADPGIKPGLNAFAIHSPTRLFGGCRIPESGKDIRRPEMWGMKFAFAARKMEEQYWLLEARDLQGAK